MGVQVGSVGMNDKVLEECCDGLRRDAKELWGFIDELSALEQDLSSYWEGDDLDTLRSGFATFKSNLEELPETIESIAKWGESVMDGYNSLTEKTTNAFNEIFGRSR